MASTPAPPRGRGKKKATIAANNRSGPGPGPGPGPAPAPNGVVAVESPHSKKPSSRVMMTTPAMVVHNSNKPSSPSGPLSGNKRNGTATGKRRRQKKEMHHEIATWWMPTTTSAATQAAVPVGEANKKTPPAAPLAGSGKINGSLPLHDGGGGGPSSMMNDFMRDGTAATELTSLSEGENWVVCSFLEDGKVGSGSAIKSPVAAKDTRPLHLSIIKGNYQNHNLYSDDPGHEGASGNDQAIMADDGAEESLAGGEDEQQGDNDDVVQGNKPSDKSGEKEIPILCIDVDNDGHCVAVKDIRSNSPLTPADDQSHAHEAESKAKYAAEGLEFFIARKRLRDQQSNSQQLLGKEQLTPLSNKAKSQDLTLKGDDKKEDMSIDSNGEGTSGYGTDDEKDANDEIEELNERSNEVRFCDVPLSDQLLEGAKPEGREFVHNHHPIAPPREIDVDKEGNLMYRPPEPLPKRQMRVLRDGDRILMRYHPLPPKGQMKPATKNNTCCEEFPCMKLEYLYGQQHHHNHGQEEGRHPHHARGSVPKVARSVQLSGSADKKNCAGDAAAMGKPRLLSVKSADVKSYEKKRFTLNSTSAADAPTIDEDDAEKKAKKQQKKHGAAAAAAAAENAIADHSQRKAGEDWSAVASQNKKAQRGAVGMMLSNTKQDKVDSNANNANANKINANANNDDDDDGMEEYSYLTGEVMIKDQDYISAITGDDATVPPSALAPDAAAEDGGFKDDEDHDGEGGGEGDAATASAVVLGATCASPSRGAGRSAARGGGAKGDAKKDTAAKNDKGKQAHSEKHKGDGAGEEMIDNKKQSAVDASESRTKNRAGEFAVEVEDVIETKEEGHDDLKFMTARTSEHTEDGDDEENNSEDELLSQPGDGDLESPEKQCRAEFEEPANGGGSDSDSETDVSKTQPFPIPKDVLNNTKDSNDLSTTDSDSDTECPEEQDLHVDNDDDQKIAAATAVDDTVTQNACLTPAKNVPDNVLKAGEQEHPDDERREPDGSSDDDDQPTQPWDIGVDKGNKRMEDEATLPAKSSEGKKVADRHHLEDDDNLSDEEPTQKFPTFKPIDNSPGNQHLVDEDDEAYLAETQDEYGEETQPLNFSLINSPAKSIHSEDNAVGAENDTDDATKEKEDLEATTPPAGSGALDKHANEDVISTPAQNEEGTNRKVSNNESKISPQNSSDNNAPTAPQEAEERKENQNNQFAAAKAEVTKNSPAIKVSAAKKPTATKDVHFDIPSPSEKSNCSNAQNRKAEKDKKLMDTEEPGQPAIEPPSPPPVNDSPSPENPGSEQQGPQSARANTAASRTSATFDDSALQKQRLENSAVHRVSSGAIMTGPVGGAVALSSQSNSPFTRPQSQGGGQPDNKQHGTRASKRASKQSKKEVVQQKQQPTRTAQPNPLVSIALQSNDPGPGPLPDAAASSEETTVCQMDNTELAKEQGSTTVNGEKIARSTSSHQQREDARLDEGRNGHAAGGDYGDRDPNMDPNIPQEVVINTRSGGFHSMAGRHSSSARGGGGVTTPTPHHHRSPKRRRAGNPQSSGRRRDSGGEGIVRIMFTGINPTRRHKQMISDIGAQLVDSIEEAASATHVIASDGKTKVRRTPKLMICICKTSQILSIEWLEQSAKEQRVLDASDFLLLGDRDAEKRYDFSMKETLENGRSARLERGGVLGGWYLYVCPGVAGNNAPSSRELNLVVEATGAIPLRSLADSEMVDPPRTIVITNDPCTAAQRSGEGVARAMKLGAKLLTTSWLFHTIITQNISNMNGDGGEVGTAGTPHSTSGRQHRKRKASKTPSHGNRRKSSRKR